MAVDVTDNYTRSEMEEQMEEEMEEEPTQPGISCFLLMVSHPQ